MVSQFLGIEVSEICSIKLVMESIRTTFKPYLPVYRFRRAVQLISPLAWACRPEEITSHCRRAFHLEPSTSEHLIVHILSLNFKI